MSKKRFEGSIDIVNGQCMALLEALCLMVDVINRILFTFNSTDACEAVNDAHWEWGADVEFQEGSKK